jgi:hypothetical protein
MKNRRNGPVALGVFGSAVAADPLPIVARIGMPCAHTRNASFNDELLDEVRKLGWARIPPSSSRVRTCSHGFSSRRAPPRSRSAHYTFDLQNLKKDKGDTR